MHDLESAIDVNPRWIFAMSGRGTVAPEPAPALVRQVRRRGELVRHWRERWGLRLCVAFVVPFLIGVLVSMPHRTRHVLSRPSRQLMTRIELNRYVYTAYPIWSAVHPDRECPRTVRELNPYLHTNRVLDAWGRRLELRCGWDVNGQRGFWLRSAGADGWFETADDLVAHATRLSP
jgi:hypothetical protein